MLWILRPMKNLHKSNNPWQPWYDKAFGFVVRADTEQDARKMAAENSGDEAESGKPNPWLDPHFSTCEPLAVEGEPGIVIKDFASA